MKKIGIIICGRYQNCGGGKCLRALRERAGAFSIYPKDEDVELVGYPPCPRIRHFKQFIESRYGIPVQIGTHPIPLKYMQAHSELPFWKQSNMAQLADDLMKEDPALQESYN